MSSDNTTQIVGLEPTYSAREAAALLGRSFSWLDQRVRNGDFVLPAVAAYSDAGDHEIPARDLLAQLASRMALLNVNMT